MFTIPDGKDETDVQYLESQFRRAFSYHGNVSVSVSFQKFDADWNEYVELDENSRIANRDKLKVVVSPRLVTPLSSVQVSIID